MLKVEKRNHAATIEKPSRNRGATVPATMPRNRATIPYRGGDMVAPSLARGSALRASASLSPSASLAGRFAGPPQRDSAEPARCFLKALRCERLAAPNFPPLAVRRSTADPDATWTRHG
jgi:hypothetical protein